MPHTPPVMDDVGTPDRDGDEMPDISHLTEQLDYEGRDIRVIRDGWGEPYRFGDFDPNPEDPDPAVWPVEEVDPGAPLGPDEDVDDLYQLTHPLPEPHVQWVTDDYLRGMYGPEAVEEVIAYEHPVPVTRTSRFEHHEPTHGYETAERTYGPYFGDNAPPSMELTDHRLEALHRVARLWNGEEVRDAHLLRDKCPAWSDLTLALDQDELRRLFVAEDTDPRVVEAFQGYDWLSRTEGTFLKPQHVLRKTVWYEPTMAGRALINGRDDLPDLRGDPAEGLRHRFTVGVAAAYAALSGAAVETYPRISGFKPDVWAGETENFEPMVWEVMTGHHNWERKRETYHKLAHLGDRATPCVVFDSRETAYETLNHWDRAGLADLPKAPYDSEYAISRGRKHVEEAYADGDIAIRLWSTTAQMWRRSLGDDDVDVDDSALVSFEW